MEGHLDHLFPWGEYDRTSPFGEQNFSWGIDFFPFNSICIEIANDLVLLVPSLLAYNLLKLLTSGKTLVDTFICSFFQ